LSSKDASSKALIVISVVTLGYRPTTAVCGIHPRGKRPDAAADEILGCAVRIFERRRSGVALGSGRI